MVLSAKLALGTVGALFGVATLCDICEPRVVSAVSSAPAMTLAAASDTATVKLAIKGMTCGGCATTARIVLQRAPGVYQADVSLEQASGVVWYDPEKTSPERFVEHLRKMTGFEASVIPAAVEGSKL